MQVISGEPVFFDIDDTLILSSKESDEDDWNVAAIKDPLNPEQIIYKRKHLPMIRLLEEEYAAGMTIIVWSRGRKEWAEAVVKALGLENKVHFVMSKPMVYFDDTSVEKWLPYRVYLPPDNPYKR